MILFISVNWFLAENKVCMCSFIIQHNNINHRMTSGLENGRENIRGAVDGGAGSVLLCIVAYFNIFCFSVSYWGYSSCWSIFWYNLNNVFQCKGETNGLSGRGKKPHERGIVFRDFDVSHLVSVINQASIICKLIFVINNYYFCSKWRTSRTWSVLWLVIVASRSRRGYVRWRTGLLRY